MPLATGEELHVEVESLPYLVEGGEAVHGRVAVLVLGEGAHLGVDAFPGGNHRFFVVVVVHKPHQNLSEPEREHLFV